MQNKGVVIVAHGSPDNGSNEAFLDYVKMVEKRMPGVPVAAGFMEYAKPTVAEAVGKLLSEGSKNIAVVPVFLSGEGHLRTDIPACIAEAAKQHPEASLYRTLHVGSHVNILRLSAKRYTEAIAGCDEVPVNKKILLVFVPHGSPEPEARQELEILAEKRHHDLPGVWVEPCFSNLGTPLLTDILPRIAHGPYSLIVIQPHLFFRGPIYDRVKKIFDAFQGEGVAKQWVITEPLGLDPLVADAIAELAEAALT